MVKVWAYAGGLGKHKPPSKGEKAAITAACEKLIADVLKPLYLQKIVPTEYNYPVDIFGKWLGNKYRFIVRFRSDNPASTVSEFDAPFARIDWVTHERFDLSYHRHTGEWWRLFEFISLAEALDHIEQGGPLRPPC